MKPKKVTDIDMALGGNMKILLPPMASIPEDFIKGRTEWNTIFSQWFFSGLGPNTKFNVKDGIDGSVALNHLLSVMRSFDPKHEHKEAGCAYLMSIWFDSVENYNK